MKTFTLSLSILIIFLFYTAVQATSIVITSPEYNVKKATLIVQVEVLEINFEKGPDGLFAVIQLKVEDQVVGNSPDIIEIRRRFIGPDLQFLETNWLPAYAVGERFIITLLPYDQNYSILGLYNGKFVIENNRIQNTNITVDQFKQLIYDIRENFTEMFPEELPRQGQDMESDHSIQKSDIQALNHECGLGVHHLDGEFNTWDQ